MQDDQKRNAHKPKRNIVLAARPTTVTKATRCQADSGANILVLGDIGEDGLELMVQVLLVLRKGQSKQLLSDTRNYEFVVLAKQ